MFIEACSCGHVRDAADILASTPPGLLSSVVNSTDDYGGTPLIVACMQGLYELVELLASVPGIDPNVQLTENKRTALHCAVFHGSLSCLERVLAVPGLLVNITDSEGATALIVACALGRDELVTALAAVPGIDPNLQVESMGISPLHHAVFQGSMLSLQSLLKIPGIQVNITDSVGKTPIDYATTLEQLILLRSHGAVIREDWPEEQAALDDAFYNACHRLKPDDLADMLILYPGLNWQDPGNEGRSALHIICSTTPPDAEATTEQIENDRSGCLIFFMIARKHAGGDVSYLNMTERETGRTPLLTAILYGKWPVAAILIKREGIDVNKSDAAGETALSAALESFSRGSDCGLFVANLVSHPGLLPTAREIAGIEAWQRRETSAQEPKRDDEVASRENQVEDEKARGVPAARAESDAKWRKFMEGCAWLLLLSVPVFFAFQAARRR